MQVELLAPAGDQESLIAAVQNGADAIYLGGTLFNARAFAKNFDYSQLLWAVEYAHLRGVRIFVTLNTLYSDDEFEDLFNYVQYLYDIQVDALIIQDIGLFDVIHQRYPDFEIHMSTQASVMNRFGAKYFEEKGASRIVLARENTLSEIQAVCQNTKLDVEVFVHGALCICYSGQCLMSSFIGKRSGNRGACAQPCRLNYQLAKDGQLLPQTTPYLLSPKDLMTIENIGDLIEAGVYSFKIEGRMKKPEYVASVVKAYRKAIDSYLQKKKDSFEEDIAYMKAMFNRDYTQGYIFNDKKLVIGDYPGNKGVIIGEVVRYDKKKKRVICQLSTELKQGDSVVFENVDKGRPINKMYVQQRLVAKAYQGDQVEIEFDYPVHKGKIRRVIDKDVIKTMQQTYAKENIKQPLSMKFVGHLRQPAQLTLYFKNDKVTHYSQEVFEKAQNQPLTKERVQQQMSKLGQTVFQLSDIHIELDNDINISIKSLNELRRSAIEELTNILMKQKIHHRYNKEDIAFETIPSSNYYFDVMVQNLEQLNVVFNYPIHRVFYPYQKDSLEALKLCKKNQIPFVLFLPRICKDKDLEEILSSKVYQEVNTVVVNEYGSYYACHDKKRIIGTGLNVFNSYSCHYYDEEKILSLEMSLKQMKNLQTDFNKCLVQVYGKIENMVSEYCPISQYHFHEQRKQCQLCKYNHYSLIDRKNAQFDIMMDEKCRMHLLNCQTLYIDQLYKIPTQGLFLHFTNEDIEFVKNVIEDYIECYQEHRKSRYKLQIDTTQGYFK